MGINPTPTNHRSFTFDGKSTREFGVYITGEGVFNAPERAVEMISIPGRDGEYALDQGHFNNIEVTYRAGIVADSTTDFAEAISNFRNWLESREGYCRLTDEYNTEEYRMAVFKNAIALEHKGLLTGEFDVTFDCKPQRFLAIGEELTEIGAWGNTETAEGEVVTIEAESDTAVKALTADIEPIQDLNGYDSPWVGGAGKNKLNAQTTAIPSGTTTELDIASINLTAGTYTLSWVLDTTVTATRNQPFYAITGQGNEYSNVDSTTAGRYNWTFTLSADSTISLKWWAHTVSATCNIKEWQLESGSSMTSYAPYENLCPITGFSAVDTNVSGKNLYAYSTFSAYTYTWYSTYTFSGTPNKTLLKKGKTYTFSATMDSGVTAWNTYLRIFDTYENLVTDASLVSPMLGTYSMTYDSSYHAFRAGGNVASLSWNITPTIDVWVNCTMTSGSGVGNNAQIEIGSTATTYEPYNGTTYTTTLPSTTYGGTLDVVSGTLKPAPYYASYNGEALEGEWISDRDKYVAGTTPTTGAQVVNIGKVGTAQQLTGQTVDLLEGTNHIFSDSGKVTVEYGHNPTLLTNPTWFPSKPLLAVEGYGEIKFNNRSIVELENATIGDVVLSEQLSAYEIIEFNIDTKLVNVGDSVTLNIKQYGMEFVAWTAYKKTSSVTISDSNSNFHTTYNADDSTPAVPRIDLTTTLSTPITITVGTSATIKNTVSGVWTLTGSSNTVTFSYDTEVYYYSSIQRVRIQLSTPSITISGADISDAGVGIGNERPLIVLTSAIGHSSVLALGNPTYIDCDIGEAYMVKDGEPISLNQYIDLGSDLPTLPSGDTEVTYDNTITKVEVKPNYWKV